MIRSARWEALHARGVDSVEAGVAALVDQHEPALGQHLEVRGYGHCPMWTAPTISPTLIGRPRRASKDTIWTRVGSASALNHDAYSVAVGRSSDPFRSFSVL